MKIGIYSPYLDTLGGGERYMLTFAEFCLQHNWRVELFWHDPAIIPLAVERFNLNLQKLVCNQNMFASFGDHTSYVQKAKRAFFLPTYDLIFWLSDGSIP